jgi:hypothetical protein
VWRRLLLCEACTFLPIAQLLSVRISAALGGDTVTAAEDLVAWPALSVAFDQDALGNGETMTGTVTINTPASAAGSLVKVSSSEPLISVPAQVTIPAGAHTASFPITSHWSKTSLESVAVMAETADGLKVVGSFFVPKAPPQRSPDPG